MTLPINISMKRTIGITRLQRGLYVIYNSGVISNCNSTLSNSFELWHLRLCHIYNIGMQDIAKYYPIIPCKNNMQPCDSCHFAK